MRPPAPLGSSRSSRRVLVGDPEFPARLSAIRSPARALWVRGRVPDPQQRGLAIVGARAATTAGCERAGAFAAQAAHHGWAIISGGALGIDAAAHRGALAAGALTFAVLGCGIDVTYPDRHAGLYEEIADAGGLLTEYAPGTPPRGPHFPARNRLVSGLADFVLVVEARLGSGALVTARLASKQGRRLLAVPGSSGTEALLSSGAAERIESEDDLGCVLAGGVPAPRRAPPVPLSPLLAALRQLPGRSGGPVELALALGISLPETLALVAEAELDGWIRRLPGGTFASLEEVSRAS
jgi:DNA processing protein